MATHVKVGVLDDIPAGEGRTYLVEGIKVAVFHARDGRVFATQAQCPHKQGPLADGLLGGAQIVCPLHERVFDLRTGESLGGEDCALKVYPVQCTPDGGLLLEID